MNKAIERANEAYPYEEGNIEYDRELVEEARSYYIEGYRQAIKDVITEVQRRKKENQWNENEGTFDRYNEDCYICYILYLMEFVVSEN